MMKVRNSAAALFGLTASAIHAVAGCGSPEGDAGTGTEAVSSGTVTGTLSIQSDWTSGYCANVTIKNGGTTPTTAWTAVLQLNQSTISSIWSVSDSVSGSQVTATALSWDAVISAGSSVSFGFCAAATGANYHPSLVSVTASGASSAGTTSSSSGATTGGSSSSSAGAASSSKTGASSSSEAGGSSSSKTGASSSSKAGGAASSSSSSSASSSSSSSSSTGSATCSVGAMPTGGTTCACSDSSCSNCNSYSGGAADGLNYGIWESGSGGSITYFANAHAFSASWGPSSADFLAHVGLDYNGTQSYASYGKIVAQFAETKSGSAGGYSSVGMYGWLQNPCVEWYIIDDSFQSMPTQRSSVTASIDGGTYYLIKQTTTGTAGANACNGSVSSWTQMLSVRSAARQCGTITVSDHFAAWANQGWSVGDVSSIHINVEVGGGTGTIEFPTASVSAND